MVPVEVVNGVELFQKHNAQCPHVEVGTGAGHNAHYASDQSLSAFLLHYVHLGGQHKHFAPDREDEVGKVGNAGTVHMVPSLAVYSGS